MVSRATVRMLCVVSVNGEMCAMYRLQVLQQPLATPTLSSPAHFWRCCYGSHPRSIVLAEHSGVSLGDFRVRMSSQFVTVDPE